MPLITRIVGPTQLCRTPVTKEYQFDLDIVSNKRLAGVLRQLSCLALQADNLICDLVQECNHLATRASRLHSKLATLTKTVNNLDAKTVPLINARLADPVATSHHYRLPNTEDADLFSSSTRPQTVVDLLALTSASPLHVIRSCDLLRTDGVSGAAIFSPVIVCSRNRTANSSLEACQSLPQPASTTTILSSRRRAEKRRAQSDSALDNDAMGEDVTACRPPNGVRDNHLDIVAIDVTGTPFNRICAQRESTRCSSSRQLVHQDTTRRKKRRHQTVSGVPGQVISELNQNGVFQVVKPSATLRTRSASRERWEKPTSMAFDDYIPRGGGEQQSDRYHSDIEESKMARSCSLRRSLRSLFKSKKSKSQDLWAGGIPSSPGPPMVDVGDGHLRRSKSLPRSLKSVMHDAYTPQTLSYERSASTEGRLDSVADHKRILHPDRAPHAPSDDAPLPKRRSRMQKLKDKIRGRKAAPENVAVSKTAPRPSLTRSYSQHTVLHHSNSISNSPLTRPKSVDTFLSSLPTKTCRPAPPARTTSRPVPVSAPEVPPDRSEHESTRGSLTRGGTHIVVDIPSQPWTKPFADVKLRGGSGCGKPDRHSSSGHWSGSSYSWARDSHRTTSIPTPTYRTHSSAGPPSVDENDSAISVNHAGSSSVAEAEQTEAGDDGASTIVGDDNLDTTFSASASDLPAAVFSMPRNGVSKKRSPTNSPSLTQHNLDRHNQEQLAQPLGQQRPYLCDDESSVYSVDQEGFYTSMHKDCGVQRAGKYTARYDDELSSVSAVSSSVSKNTGSKSLLYKLPARSKRRKRPDNSQTSTQASTLPRAGKLQLNEDCLTPHASPSLEYSRLAAAADKMAAQEEKRSKLNAPVSNRSWYSTLPTLPVSNHDDVSETDSIFSRVRDKSSFSGSVIPSLVSVTPVHSDGEDAVISECGQSWRKYEDVSGYCSSTLMSTHSAPGDLAHNKVIRCHGMASIKELSHDASETSDVLSVCPDKQETNAYSTWPRSPNSSFLSASKPKSKPNPPRRKSVKKTVACHLSGQKGGPNLVSVARPPEGITDLVSVARPPEGITDYGGRGQVTLTSFKCAKRKGSELTDKKSQGVCERKETELTDEKSKDVPERKGSELTDEKSKDVPERKGSELTDEKSCEVALTNLGECVEQSSTVLQSASDKDRKTDLSVSNESPGRPCQLDLVCPDQPNPVSARLIITSPVSSKAMFVENPQKRLVCTPVSADDLERYATYEQPDRWYNELPRSPRQCHDTSHTTNSLKTPVLTTSSSFDFTQEKLDSLLRSSSQVSMPLFPSLSAMKHSLSFPVTGCDRKDSEQYGGSWYDTMKTAVVDVQQVVTENSSPVVKPIETTPSKVSFTSFLRSQSGVATEKASPEYQEPDKNVDLVTSLHGGVPHITGIVEEEGKHHSPISLSSFPNKTYTSNKSNSRGPRPYSQSRPRVRPMQLSVSESHSKLRLSPVSFTETHSSTDSTDSLFSLNHSPSKSSPKPHKSLPSPSKSSSTPTKSLPNNVRSLPSPIISLPNPVKSLSTQKTDDIAAAAAAADCPFPLSLPGSHSLHSDAANQSFLDCSLSSDPGSPPALHLPEPMPLLTSYNQASGLFKPPSDPTNISSKQHTIHSEPNYLTLPTKARTVMSGVDVRNDKLAGCNKREASPSRFGGPRSTPSPTNSKPSQITSPSVPSKQTQPGRKNHIPTSSSNSMSTGRDIAARLPLSSSSTTSVMSENVHSSAPVSQLESNSKPVSSLSAQVADSDSDAAKLLAPSTSGNVHGIDEAEKQLAMQVVSEGVKEEVSTHCLRAKTKVLAKSTTNLHEGGALSVAMTTSTHRRSLGNLSSHLSASSLSLGVGMSSISLACSTDSLASCGSLAAERTRSAKLAFMSSSTDVNDSSEMTSSIGQQFARYSSLGSSRSNLSMSRSNLTVLSEQRKEEETSTSQSTLPKSDQSKYDQSMLNHVDIYAGAGKRSALQGRFISSVINQFQTDKVSTTPSRCSSTHPPPAPSSNKIHTTSTTTPSFTKGVVHRDTATSTFRTSLNNNNNNTDLKMVEGLKDKAEEPNSSQQLKMILREKKANLRSSKT